jgi:tryptophan-rich sensory protein
MLPESAKKNTLLQLYAINLLLNVLWSFVFFGNKNANLAFLIIICMIISLIYILYYTKMLLPEWNFNLLLPYLFWLIFATILNYGSLNKKC